MELNSNYVFGLVVGKLLELLVKLRITLERTTLQESILQVISQIFNQAFLHPSHMPEYNLALSNLANKLEEEMQTPKYDI